jgi:hypothetical protein
MRHMINVPLALAAAIADAFAVNENASEALDHPDDAGAAANEDSHS